MSIDFIVKLLISKEPMTGTEYNSILVIIKRLTCYKIFILYIEASTVEDLAYIVSKCVVTTYRMPKE